MTHKKHPQGLALSLGATSIAAALAIGSSAVYAQENEPCDNTSSAECAAQNSDEAIEQIKIHGIRHSIYRVNKSGDPRRLADLVVFLRFQSISNRGNCSRAGEVPNLGKLLG